MNVGDNLNKIVDEYTYATLVDKDLAAQRLERLLKSYFVTRHSMKREGRTRENILLWSAQYTW